MEENLDHGKKSFYKSPIPFHSQTTFHKLPSNHNFAVTITFFFLVTSFLILLPIWAISANQLDQFYAMLNYNNTPSTSLAQFNSVYHIIVDKDKYAGGVGLDDIQQLYHFIGDKEKYEGPRSARLRKKALPKLVSPYCPNPELYKSKVRGEVRSYVDSTTNFVGGLMGKCVVKPMFIPAGKWQLYTVVGPIKTIRHQVIACHKKDYRP